MRSCAYKLKGDASGTNCGPLSDAEKAELDKMKLEEIKTKWARVNQNTIKKAGQTSKYRGVNWCVACRGRKSWADAASQGARAGRSGR